MLKSDMDCCSLVDAVDTLFMVPAHHLGTERPKVCQAARRRLDIHALTSSPD